MNILDGLTDRQREAVTHGEGPLLVVAGAGSGKTRVITRRVAYLAARGIPPYRILAITFTNKAADEMKFRVADLAGVRGAWVSTFHSMCARMLRQFSDLLGFEHPFTIYDRADSLACVKAAVEHLGLTASGAGPASLLNAIGRAKNEMRSPDELAKQAVTRRQRLAARVYRKYEQIRQANNALDFDDLLLWTAELLGENADFRTYWQTRFQHVLIDEYQDTNRPQYVIARQLSAGHGNICATGDPDQSIYAWRGADIRNILDFREDYPSARTVKLEENFRSTKMILLAASGVIDRNEARIERGLWTRNLEGTPVEIVRSRSDIAEGDAIVDGIRESVSEGRDYGDMAIFYRTHAQSRVLESSLRDAGVPYQILDAVEFYNRKEIKDIVAYLKLILNPADGISLLRIINEPRRGIGKKSVGRLSAFAADNGIGIPEAVGQADRISALPARATGKVKEFAALLAALRKLPRSPVADLVRAVLDRTGYLARLERSDDAEDAGRAENVKELVNAAAEFDLDYPDEGLEVFLERVTLVSNNDAMTGDAGRVLLMTLHSAKGLEFPVVFVAGVQEGLLPHANALGSSSRIEEERRLCYVGMTRAKERLCLHYASEQFTFGRREPSDASRFLGEIPADAKRERAPERAPSLEDLAATGGPAAPGERVIEYDPDMLEYSQVQVGRNCRLRHPNFGEGRVVSVSGSGERTRLVVDFGGRRRHLMLKYIRPDWLA
ncbi:MAG: UvrD-helicase domain-containing protein [Planctomycetota bacterium]